MLSEPHEISPQVTWSRDSRRAVLVTHGQIGPGTKRIAPSIAVWDAAQGQQLWSEANHYVRSFAWSPNGEQLLVARNTQSPDVQIISASGKPSSESWTQAGQVLGVAWASQGERWACGIALRAPDGDSQTPKLELHALDGSLRHHFGLPENCAARYLNPVFSPDGKLVAWSALNSKTLRNGAAITSRLRGERRRMRMRMRMRNDKLIRSANVPLPSPLWGEGLGVRGD